MEERFQKQIEKIASIRKLNNTKQKEEREESSIKERQEQEVKRFNEHVQKNFIEYVLKIFEEYTMEKGNFTDIVFYERKCDVRMKGNEGDLPLEQRIYMSSAEDYLYIYRTIVFNIRYDSGYVDKAERYFEDFYSDYVPQENFASVVIPNWRQPNLYHFKTQGNCIILGIDDLKKLFKAVSVNYKVERYYNYDGDSLPSQNSYCTIDNVLEIRLYECFGVTDYQSGFKVLTVQLLVE